MNNKIKYNYTLILISAFLVISTSIAFYFYWDLTREIIRYILECKFTIFIVWVITILIFIVHYFTHKSKDVEGEPIITKKFGAFIDNALGGVSYGTTMTTSITLLKGLYIQKFFVDKVYFKEFQDIDLMAIFGVTLFLLYISVMKVIEISRETYKTAEHTEIVLNEQKIIVIPKEKPRAEPNR